MLQFDPWRCILLDKCEKVAFPPHIMTLAIKIFARCFAFLITYPLLLFFYPAELRDGPLRQSSRRDRRADREILRRTRRRSNQAWRLTIGRNEWD